VLLTGVYLNVQVLGMSLVCDVPGYLTFLDQHQHRDLLRCFVCQSQKRSWSFDELRLRMGHQLSPEDLEAALSFCELHEFLILAGQHGNLALP
jgi:hypothetical protein